MAEIRWTESAFLDLEAIGQYIAKDSPYQADRVVNEIRTTPRLLKEHPEIGRVVSETAREDIRELLYGNYRIIYFVQPNICNIIAVYHAARNIKKREITKRLK